MAFDRPILDDRSYEQIRDDLIKRIPVYAPEWTDHNVSDPGIALIELFAYLTENVLYRFNQIPEATQLQFLNLLDMQRQAAVPARAQIAFDTRRIQAPLIEQGRVVKSGDVVFTTRDEVQVLPITAVAAGKMLDEEPEAGTDEAEFFMLASEAAGIEDGPRVAYRTETVWVDEPGVARNFDQTVDGILWIAILAEKPAKKTEVMALLGSDEQAPVSLNIGFVPQVDIEPVVDTTTAEFAQRFRCPDVDISEAGSGVQWQISTAKLVSSTESPSYRPLQVIGDTTNGLRRDGVIRLRLPANMSGVGEFTVDDPNLDGTGDLPPPLDDALSDRLVFWIRAFRTDGKKPGAITYLGANAVSVEQTEAARSQFLGVADGQPGREYTLNHRNVVKGSVNFEVESGDRWLAWGEVDHFFASSESDLHFSCDYEAGVIRLGNGLQGFLPQIGQRLRVQYQHGGGSAGNVAADTINKMVPKVAGVEVSNPLQAHGGDDAESVAAALQRIPGELKRCNRAMTTGDFKTLAFETPGAALARAEVLPRYHPQFPDADSAGVVSVIVWPKYDSDHPNAPMPNRNQLRSVCAYLDQRRLVTTELYVMPPKYKQVAVAVGIKVKDGFGVDAVRHWVELVLRQYLAPLPPYGPNGQGWPLGRRVQAAELIAAAHQVEGVEYLEELTLIGWDTDGSVIDDLIPLDRNEVPELTGITVESGPITVAPGSILNPVPPSVLPVPIPVIREEC